MMMTTTTTLSRNNLFALYLPVWPFMLFGIVQRVCWLSIVHLVQNLYVLAWLVNGWMEMRDFYTVGQVK
ncbi:hypothetical protein F5B22DRAFT_627842 [Xylaria bambusicola]|uniref:uncharacterized protein n=1 Tax=Xylaria bambusicola TaxID=326684 RepID=UPI002008B1B8|nr:uncharacterized protein F5B22DRAFT_627842 [Xylaria bambusicola]KAI0505467.1 hypothetical protein F5B22DRAFT_627842 [Xylaria bambusicola]